MKKLSLNLFLISVVCGIGAYSISNYLHEQGKEQAKELKSFVRSSVSQIVVQESSFPEKIHYKDEVVTIDYTINSDLQKAVELILKRYPNDHSAVVVLDNNTGSILAVAGIERKNRRLNYSLPFTSTHPSASLIKIITTANLLENDQVEPSTRLNYRGRGTTLYKYQLKNKISRWTRWISFKKAFAFSNNVIFGKAAINKSSGQSIFQTAFKFGFNQELMEDFNLGPSRFIMPETQYQLAELASGFNKETLVSPVHAALFASIVANEGQLKKPYIVNSYTMDGEEHTFKHYNGRVFSKDTSVDLANMMELTTSRGTARSITRGRNGNKIRDRIITGAKTGSITGGIPEGKRDWLTLYAKPKNDLKDKGISISIMNINGKKWYFKSTYMAKKLLMEYLKILDKEEISLSSSKDGNVKG